MCLRIGWPLCVSFPRDRVYRSEWAVQWNRNSRTLSSCDGCRGFLCVKVDLGTARRLGCFGRTTFRELAKNIEGCDTVGFGICGKVKDIVDKRFDRCAALKR